MSDNGGSDRRRTFDEAATIYHDARPEYPEAIFDRLMGLVPSHPRVIEVGPGTGQATEPLLQRGATIRAIEIGPRLAEQLVHRLDGFVEPDKLEVIVGDFEDVEPDGWMADAVVSATAYHWISPAEQLARPRRWLTPTGRLAVIDTMQVESAVDGGYFEQSQPIYASYAQGTGGASQLPETVRPVIHDRMTNDPSCTDVTLDRYRWDQTYTSQAYRALLNTYSGTLAMPEPARTALVDDLVELVDDLGGTLTRPLVITLATCRFGKD